MSSEAVSFLLTLSLLCLGALFLFLVILICFCLWEDYGYTKDQSNRR